MYKILRKFMNSGRTIVIDDCVSLEHAQTWCRNPNSSSRSCTDTVGKARTKRSGPWFDCYEAR